MATSPKTKPNTTAEPSTAATTSKRELIVGLLKGPDGASLDEMVSATGWLPHTTRAMLTGLKKKSHVLSSEKVAGVRRYRIAGGAAQ
jgi:Protein of unknown function (DUF3489)